MRADRFERFCQCLDGQGPATHLTPAELCQLAMESSLSVAEAATELDRLARNRGWERVLVDDRGRALSPEAALAKVRAFAFGLPPNVKVVWRRRRSESVLVA